jgi:ParB family chromosome partitioning protein
MKQRIFTPAMPMVKLTSASGPDSPEGSIVELNSLNLTGRLIRSIDVKLIDPNPFAPRDVYSLATIAERAEALRVQGQHDPIHVIPNQDIPGRYIIADGWTRVRACIEHSVFNELLAEVHTDLSVEEASWFGYEQNEERQQLCDLDKALFYEKLIATGIPSVEVARRAKQSKTMMSFYRSYMRLPEDVLEIIRQNPNKFGANVAYHLQKLHDKLGLRKTVALTSKFAAEDQTVRWLINQVQSLLNPNAVKAAPPSKQVKYVNGYYKQKGDTFEVSISVAEEHRTEFSNALEALLDKVAVQILPTEIIYSSKPNAQ